MRLVLSEYNYWICLSQTRLSPLCSGWQCQESRLNRRNRSMHSSTKLDSSKWNADTHDIHVRRTSQQRHMLNIFVRRAYRYHHTHTRLSWHSFNGVDWRKAKENNFFQFDLYTAVVCIRTAFCDSRKPNSIHLSSANKSIQIRISCARHADGRTNLFVEFKHACEVIYIARVHYNNNNITKSIDGIDHNGRQ